VVCAASTSNSRVLVKLFTSVQISGCHRLFRRNVKPQERRIAVMKSFLVQNGKIMLIVRGTILSNSLLFISFYYFFSLLLFYLVVYYFS